MSKKILQLTSADFEDLEVWYPVYRSREEGWQVDFAAETPGLYHGKYGVPCNVELSFKDVNPDDYDGLLVPGGWAPDKLRRFPFAQQVSLETAFARLSEYAEQYMQELSITGSDLYGVMLSVPGTVDYDTMTLRYNVKAPEWGVNIALGERLKAIFGEDKAYFVGNAGKSTGRAILIDEPECEQRRVMTLFTAWGVSACMIERGHVLNGRDSLIGEIGHMIISDNADMTCACGKRGCLESLISLGHVRDMLRAQGADDLCEGLTLPRLFEHSAAGDARAQAVVRILAHDFAVALHNLSLCYNQEVVVIQGDFAWADELFDSVLKAELSQFRYYPQEPFAVVYDRRDISLLSLRGGAEVIKKKYFASLD